MAKPPSSVFFAESAPAWMARQMSTLLVPVRSTASCRLKTVIATCPIGVAREGSRGTVNAGLRPRPPREDEAPVGDLDLAFGHLCGAAARTAKRAGHPSFSLINGTLTISAETRSS